jgi:hypothetical protein
MTKILTIRHQAELENSLNELLSDYEARQIFVLCDHNSKTHCLPLIANFPCLKEAQHIIVPAGDEHKNLETLSAVWSSLSRKGGTRKSLNIGVLQNGKPFAEILITKNAPKVVFPPIKTSLSLVQQVEHLLILDIVRRKCVIFQFFQSGFE